MFERALTFVSNYDYSQVEEEEGGGGGGGGVLMRLCLDPVALKDDGLH